MCDNNKRNFIQNKEVIPDTHVFVYRDKEYPFKIDYFKYVSRYFSENLYELEGTKIIRLLDSTTEKRKDISEETINDFINYVQCQKIEIHKENVFQLNFLSKKYEVLMLEEKTQEYIKENAKDLVYELLKEESEREEKGDFSENTRLYEEIISENLDKYLNDDRLLVFNIPRIYRIIINYEKHENEKYEKKNQERKRNQKLNDFLFRCIKKFGREASVLFSIFNFGETEREIITRIINDYPNDFDFSFIHKQMTEIIKESQKELEQNIIEMKEMREKHKELKTEIIKQKEIFEKTFNEIKNEFDQLKNENDKMKEENKALKEKNEKIENQYLMKIDELNQMKVEQEQLINKEKKYSLIIEQQKQLLEQKSKGEHERKTIKIEYEKGNEFNGIIRYLTNQTGSNVHDNYTVEVTSNSIHPNHHPKYLLDSDQNNFYSTKNSIQDAWICFDFKDRNINLLNYSIRSCNNDPGKGHLKNWVIEISNDGNNWTEIDQHRDCSDLNGRWITKIFEVSTNKFSRYIRIRNIGEYFGYDDRWCFGFNSIEFFGNINEP